jgi:chemotaxis protein MotB
MNDWDTEYEDLAGEIEEEDENAHLWIISFSDFMTILMIFFLILFAHRLWEKKVFWEDQRFQQLRAAQETQVGVVQRLSKMVALDVQAERVNIQLPDALLFSSGKAVLQEPAKVLLKKLGPELRAFSGEIVVEGHTDDLPPGKRSPYQTNWELSVARSFSVIAYLTEIGMDPKKISARGYGPYRPRAPNISPENREMNRRIEIVLLNPKKDKPRA